MKKFMIAIPLIFVLSLGSALLYYFSKEDNVKISTVHGNAIADFSDKRNLVGFADNVLIGEVVEELDQETWHIPVSKFRIKISGQIKGELSDEYIDIYQYGGYDKEEKTLVLVNDNPLIEKNKNYVFALKKQEDGKMLLVPENGATEINDKDSKIKLIDEFKVAHKNQKNID